MPCSWIDIRAAAPVPCPYQPSDFRRNISAWIFSLILAVFPGLQRWSRGGAGGLSGLQRWSHRKAAGLFEPLRWSRGGAGGLFGLQRWSRGRAGGLFGLQRWSCGILLLSVWRIFARQLLFFLRPLFLIPLFLALPLPVLNISSGDHAPSTPALTKSPKAPHSP